ncbi:MAG: FAD:protein FMN transferase [Planctomycetota bacterium]
MKDGRRWMIRLTAAALLGFFAWYISQPDPDAYTRFQGEAFATPYRVMYRGGVGRNAVRDAVEAELARIDAMASTWREDSELMRYNRAGDPEGFELSVELAELIEHAKRIEAETGGAFSPRPGGKQLDLSGIAKGYAVDRVVELLQAEFDIVDCLIDIGGEVKALGNGPKGVGWHVGLYSPSQLVPDKLPVLILRDTSAATSGAYFKGDHILDPATGKPVVNDLVSASVVHPSNATADALATALYVMGSERGLAWAEDKGIHAVLLLKDGTRLEHELE